MGPTTDLGASLAPSVLITGAAGFIGANLVRKLIDRGHRPHATVRPGPLSWRVTGLGERVHWHRVDLTQPDAARNLCADVKPTIIVHGATFGAYGHQNDVGRMIDTNVRATQSLLESARRSGTKLFINLGSSSEYGPKTNAMAEHDAAEPDRPYGATKLAQTQLCRLASDDGMKVLTLRLFSAYGPWEAPGRLMTSLVSAALSGQTFVGSSPHVVRDFVWIDDLSDCVLDFESLARVDVPVVNLGTGTQTRLDELVALARRTLNPELEVRWSESRLNPWDQAHWRADTSMARRTLPHAPATELSVASKPSHAG